VLNTSSKGSVMLLKMGVSVYCGQTMDKIGNIHMLLINVMLVSSFLCILSIIN